MIARQAGGILNIASTAAFQPGPWIAVYYASKAFVLSFSEALHEEVKPHGVRVAALAPARPTPNSPAVAGMGDMALFKNLASGADAVVRDGLAALDDNQAVRVSGAANMLMAESIRFTPALPCRGASPARCKARPHLALVLHTPGRANVAPAGGEVPIAEARSIAPRTLPATIRRERITAVSALRSRQRCRPRRTPGFDVHGIRFA